MVASIYPIGPVKRLNVAKVAGSQSLILGVTGKRLLILSLHVHCEVGTDATVIVQDSSVSPVQLFGTTTAKIVLSKGGTIGPRSITLPFSERGWFQTTASKGLNAIIVGASGPKLTFNITYTEVDA